MNERENFRALDALAVTGLAAAAVIWTVIHQRGVLGTIAPTLDDTYIHIRFAMNLASGNGFAFNPGESIPGSTSPLWVILLAPFSKGGADFMSVTSVILSALTFIALPPLTYLLAFRLGLKRGAAVTAGILTALNGRLLWAGMSGMETDLFSALSIVAVISLLKEEERGSMGYKSGALFGLASLARPEGYLLFALALLHGLINNRRKEPGRGLTRIISDVPWKAIVPFAVLVLPYMIFSLIAIHHPFPSTYSAKLPELERFRLTYLYWSGLYMLMDNALVLVLFLAGAAGAIYLAAKKKLDYLSTGPALIAGWAVFYLAASTLLTPMPYHFCRYQVPLIPFFILVAVGAGAYLADRLARMREGGRARLVIFAFLVAFSLLGNLGRSADGGVIYKWPSIVTTSAKNIVEMHVAAGKWLNRVSSPGDVVATMDIGAIGLYSEREILDLAGLVTPEIVPRIEGMGITERRSWAIYDFLLEKKPRFIAVFPEELPGILDGNPVFEPLAEIRLDDNQIVRGNWIVIYQCYWSRAENTPAVNPR